MAKNRNQDRDHNDDPDRRAGSSSTIPVIELPTTKTPVSTTLASRILLFHGDPKSGKTVTANDADGGTLFLRFEPGHDHIEHLGITINTWVDAIGAIDALERARASRMDLPYRNVAIDTAGMAFLRCTEFVLAQLGIIHESDANYGKGSQMIAREFRRQITRLCNLGLGVILIAHSADKTFSNGKTGAAKSEWTKRVVDLPKNADSVVVPLADLILFFTKEYNEKEDEWIRVIKTSRTDVYDAGGRYPPGWDPLPESLPMAYRSLVEAWNAGAPAAAVERAEAERRAKETAAEEAAEIAALKKRLADLKDQMGPIAFREAIVTRPEATLVSLRAAVARVESTQNKSKEAGPGPGAQAQVEEPPPPPADAPPPARDPEPSAPKSAPPPETHGVSMAEFRKRLRLISTSERRAQTMCMEDHGRDIGGLTMQERALFLEMLEAEDASFKAQTPGEEEEETRAEDAR